MTTQFQRRRPRRSGGRLLLAALAGEPGVLRAVLRAITGWLTGNRRAVLDNPPSEPPNMAAWLPQRAWEDLVHGNITPAAREVWLRRWRDTKIETDPDRWLDDYLADVRNRLTGFPDESYELVRLQLMDGIRAGDSIPELRDRVGRALRIDAPSRDLLDKAIRQEKILRDPEATREQKERARAKRRDLLDRKDAADRQWQWRAERIARTETISSHNAASFAASVVASDEEDVRLGLQWWATADDRTRRTHRAAHGQTVPVGQPFRVGQAMLRYPGDPTGPASEVVNCRCVALDVELD